MEKPAPMVDDIVNKAGCPMHHSDAASNPSRPAVFKSGFVAELYPRFCGQLDWDQGCLAATNLEVDRSDHDLL